ncbi:MAG TPA: MBL fold metallo-hydrolase [Terriglobales bacterium]|nr:MBL fold metallo-hydrolase [Terriglobales bacterium]
MSWRALILVSLLAASCAAQTRVIMLGSGNPNANPDRSGPAVAVVVNGEVYLVDAGPGVVRRAAAAHLMVTDLDHLFITHLHSDHTLGLPDLMFTPWVLGRKTPIEAYGPAGLSAMARNIEAAWSEDIAVRTQGLEHAAPTGYQMNVHEINAGAIFKDANIAVTAFSVRHGSWKEALGYRFQTADRVIVFSGDTAPTYAAADACNGCDLLFYEVYNPGGTMTPAWRKYMAAFHTSTDELGPIATRAHPKLLVLYHQMGEGASEDALLARLRQSYHGAVVASRDLQVF